jgi:hypothetical protein
MDLRSQLPKIGKEINGKVYLGDDEFKIFCGSRPDYEKIKMGYATESECVEALLGVNSPLDLMKEALEQQWHKASDLTPDKTLDSDHPAYMRYIELVSLFHEITTAIDIGIAEGKIRVVLEHEDSKNGEWEFSDSKILDTQSFFSWMHDRGYPIPDELAIQKEKKPKQKIISTPPKTQWHQIHFRIVNRNDIEVKTPDKTELYQADDLGFTFVIWDLFERFAAEDAEYIASNKHDISRLRGLLKKVFPGVEGDPIPLEKGKGYKAEFHITEE